MQPRTRKALATGYSCVAVGYGLYAGYAYAEPFRTIAETQLALLDKYYVMFTAFVTVAVLLVPAYFIAGREGRAHGERARGEREARHETGRADPEWWLGRSRRAFAWGLALLFGGPLVGLAVYALWPGPTSAEWSSLVIDDTSEPESEHVLVEGTMQAPMMIVWGETVRSLSHDHAIVPVTPADWEEGDPVRYFAQTDPNLSYQDPNGTDFARHRSLREGVPFSIREKFVVSGKAVPGMVREQYARLGVPIAEPHYVLERVPYEWEQSGKRTGVSFAVGALLSVIGGLGGIGGGIGARRRARQIQRARGAATR